jgi:hypothetical protein
MPGARANAIKREQTGRSPQIQQVKNEREVMVFTRQEVNKMWVACAHNDKRKSEIAVSWNQQHSDMMWVTHTQMCEQAKLWRGWRREGKVNMLEANLFTREDHLGKTWNFLVVQPSNLEHCNIDRVALMEFDIAVSGFAYFFKSKSSRDEIYRYVNDL